MQNNTWRVRAWLTTDTGRIVDRCQHGSLTKEAARQVLHELTRRGYTARMEKE